jgi:metallo-beta-lactamase class B
MRQTLLLIATIAACACASSPAPPPTPALPPQPPVLATEKINDELVVRQLDPHTWVVTHTVPYPANSLVVEADDGSVMLVDTPWTPEATKVMLDWFESKLGKRRFNAFITHFHLDALGGAPELKRRGIGARAHGAIEDLLAERGAARRQSLVDSLADRPELAEKFAKAEMLRPPSLYVAGKFGLPLGMKERYTLLNPAPSHSPDLTVVMLEERGILFGSCAVRSGDSLGPLDDADLAGWRTAVTELKALNPKIVVPGHGDRLDPQLLDHTLALLDRAPAQNP